MFPAMRERTRKWGPDILREIFDRRSCDTRFSECMLDASRDAQTGVRQCPIQIEHQLHPQFRPATLLHLIATVPPVAPRSEFSFTAELPSPYSFLPPKFPPHSGLSSRKSSSNRVNVASSADYRRDYERDAQITIKAYPITCRDGCGIVAPEYSEAI
jgi:hypothetical protein